MPSERPGQGEIDATPGLAGGPGPTPPGVDDGLPAPRAATPEAPDVPAAEEQREEGERAERSAGVRRADVPGLRDEREGRGRGGTDAGRRERTRR